MTIPLSPTQLSRRRSLHDIPHERRKDPRHLQRWTAARSLLSAAAAAALLSACANPWTRVAPGESVAQVTAALGTPRERYPLPGGGENLLWPTQPMGETTTAVEVDASGRAVHVEQVLTNASFNRAVMDRWTEQDVLTHFGQPVYKSYFRLMKRAVWTYRYMDSDVWYMMYNFYFDDQGILRTTSKSPDPLHDPDARHFGLN